MLADSARCMKHSTYIRSPEKLEIYSVYSSVGCKTHSFAKMIRPGTAFYLLLLLRVSSIIPLPPSTHQTHSARQSMVRFRRTFIQSSIKKACAHIEEVEGVTDPAHTPAQQSVRWLELLGVPGAEAGAEAGGECRQQGSQPDESL